MAFAEKFWSSSAVKEFFKIYPPRHPLSYPIPIFASGQYKRMAVRLIRQFITINKIQLIPWMTSTFTKQKFIEQK